MNEKQLNILIYDAAFKTLYDTKPLRIIFDKVDGYFRKYDMTKYRRLFHPDEKCDLIKLDILLC